MIRLRGQDAYDQACETAHHRGILSIPAPFFFENDDRNFLLPPEDVLRRVRDGGLRIEHLSCDIASMWKVLQKAREEEGSFLIHRGRNTVLFFNREFGADLGCGVQCFAVLDPVFQNAVQWARRTPAVEKDLDLYNFILNLSPRMLLQKGQWQCDAELFRHSIEIAAELARIFHLASSEGWTSGEHLINVPLPLAVAEGSALPRGKILDLVLEKVREDLEDHCRRGKDKRELLKELGTPALILLNGDERDVRRGV